MYTTGICWRDDVVSGMTGSWNDLVNPTADGRAFILDDFQEAIGEANYLNGFDLNDENPDHIDRSKETLLDQKPHMRGFSTNSVQNLTSGLAVLHHAWNGDIVNVRNVVDNPEDFKFETCKEGVPVGSDTMAIPVNARSPGTALLFIDWILEPEHAARNVAWNGYPQPVDGGTQEFSKLVKEEPTIDITIEQLQTGDEFRFATPVGRELWTETWTEVKV
jgi:spermidine/putrescine transport system substrate-binding protein